jgi:hypothetical protein
VHSGVYPTELNGDMEEVVIETSNLGELSQIGLSCVQAAIHSPNNHPTWLVELAAAVKTGAFQVPRIILKSVTLKEIEARLDTDIPTGVLSIEGRTALKEDMLSLVDKCREFTGTNIFRFRFMTSTPNCDCGFHVDTVPAEAPTVGLLRIYCGAGTEYIHPTNITNIADFYRYVFRRDQITQQLRATLRQVDSEAYDRKLAQRTLMDDNPPFTHRPKEKLIVPAGSIVAFKLVDSRFLWSNHLICRQVKGWIHRSPMTGDQRFLASVNADMKRT